MVQEMKQSIGKKLLVGIASGLVQLPHLAFKALLDVG
jgi:hypothetical protein